MRLLIVLVAAMASVAAEHLRAADPALKFAKGQDAFFIENDFAYRRFLMLARDGTYQQINRERTTAAEVDRGTWEQSADGTILLHFTRGGLRFRALLSGPLSIRVENPRDTESLSTAASAIRRWLTASSNAVFAAESAHEITMSPLVLTVDPKAESFRRADLESLANQIDNFVWSEQNRTFCLKPVITDGQTLLVQKDAVFQTSDLARVRREYSTRPEQPPPFYFARVNAGTFAREAGSWQELR